MSMMTQGKIRQTGNRRRWGSRLLAVAVLGLAGSVHAGKITSVPSASGAPGFGGWNFGNVQVVLNGAGSWFDPLTGAYSFAVGSDFTYQANVFDMGSPVFGSPAIGSTVMGIVLAKDWPVGEPSGIKIVNDDPGAKQGKPANCIMATSYLKGYYLDSAAPKQVICSSPFQTHKRFKVAMLPLHGGQPGRRECRSGLQRRVRGGRAHVRGVPEDQQLDRQALGRLQGRGRFRCRCRGSRAPPQQACHWLT